MEWVVGITLALVIVSLVLIGFVLAVLQKISEGVMNISELNLALAEELQEKKLKSPFIDVDSVGNYDQRFLS